MRGEVTVDAARQLMRFQFDQRATIQDWREAQAVVLQLSEEKGVTRVLVDVRKQNTVEHAAELFEFGANLPPNIAFAVLSEPRRDDHRFVETVALNRGKNVSLFFGPEEDAVEWLMKWRPK